MKVLYFTKYSQQGASSRLRSFQYFPYLEKSGLLVTVKPFFDDAYLKSLYLGKKNKAAIIKAYFKRFINLGTVFRYDVVVIEKELFPYFFSWFERLLAFLGVSYIVDYDDAIFHNYDLSTNKWIRFFLKNKINMVMRCSNCVIAGNSYLAHRAKIAGAQKIEIIPTVIDLDRYQVKNEYATQQVTIGWIGSPSTFKYVKQIAPVLKQLVARYNVKINIVGAKEDLGFGDNMHYISWTEDSEVESILDFDIGIMPLEDTPWELGKCSYKIIQYMACGVPVVASAVGMNKEVVQEGEQGFLVTSEKDWFTALEKLICNTSLREALGTKGRAKVAKEYCLQQTQGKLTSLLKNSSQA